MRDVQALRFRQLLLVGLFSALAACSGGGGGAVGPTPPSIQDLVVSPTLVYVARTQTTFVSQFQVSDPNGDLDFASLVIRDAADVVIASQTTPIQQANGLTAAQLVGSTIVTISAPGVFTAHLTLTDRAVLVSNELTATIEARPFPWTSAARVPNPVRQPAAATIGDRVYVVGGERTDLFTQGPASGAANAYDPALDAWTALPPLPTPRVRLTATASGGRLYAIGGATTLATLPIGTASGVVEEFDPLTSAWRTRAPMPTPRAFAAAAELDGRIVVVGGDSGDGYTWFAPLTVVESYDPVANTWTTLPPLPRARAQVHAIVLGGKLWVGGNEVFRTDVDDEFDVYDPVANEWSVVAYPYSATDFLLADADAAIALTNAGLWGSDDLANQNWRELTSPTLPQYLVGAGPSALVGRRIIVFGEFATARYSIDDEIR